LKVAGLHGDPPLRDSLPGATNRISLILRVQRCIISAFYQKMTINLKQN